MAIFKCKMCGGTMEFEQGGTVGVCEFCGTKQTLPRLDDDRKANLYDRANHFRRNNDFDKAMAIYEQILNEDKNDAEAYWSLVLCRYGIEYVEDPATHKRIPTVNRAQYTSIFADEDYKSALRHADIQQKIIYEEEAKAIDEIQKGILAISQKEEPFDVFICYKETDQSGRRTPDSVLANDLYHQLTQEGFKVFYAAITLESKLGAEYEPYIFSALNTAKVMLSIGTKPEYFNAVWVKNEWSRFLKIMKKDRSKLLIPCYKDMDPYELPEEFAHLQAQDMGKIGFINDVVRGIKKVIAKDEPKPAAPVVVQTAAPAATSNVTALLKRGYMALEDSEWTKADGFFEEVLNQDAENAQAYLGKLMAELKVRKQANLKNCSQPFDDQNNYKKTVRFADQALKDELEADNTYIRNRNETARKQGIYDDATDMLEAAKAEDDYKKAAARFKDVSGFKDADKKAKECLEKAEAARKDAIYDNAAAKMKGEYITPYKDAIERFKTIPGWKDSDQKIKDCEKKIEELEERQAEEKRQAELDAIEAAKRRKKKNIILAISAAVVAAAVAFVILLTNVIIPNMNYSDAVELMEAGKYEEAIAAFEAMDGYKDSNTQIENCQTALKDIYYDAAVALMNEGKTIDAYDSFIALDGYKDSAEKANEIYDQYKVEKLKNPEVGDTVFFGTYEQDNNTSNGKEEIEWIVLAKEDGKALLISEYALECQPYNSSYADVTWEACSLRTWMNGTFLNDAFSSAEQAMIATTNVSADKNPKYRTNPGNTTNDKVFLLSITETEEYFTSDEARECAPTAYAKAQGARTSDRNKTSSGEATCRWWLRSPGNSQNYAACVYDFGSVDNFGDHVGYGGDCVRPAMWINLDS